MDGAQAQSIVHTDCGDIAGSAGEVRIFRGIPYAAPPVGNLRWHAPVPPAKWQGVRSGLEFGPDPVQAEQQGRITRAPRMDEDCLYLNVWTPAQDANAKLPVMVWLSVGGFLSSSGATTQCDGEHLAKKGVVVVTVSCRVGLFGYLGHPQLRAESEGNVSGNYGLLDLMAALRWVKTNIAQFGGNADQVTIFGTSAGAAAASLLITSPLTKGLFRGAIMHSPGAFRPLATIEDAEEVGMTLGKNIADVRKLSAAEVFARTGDFVPKQRGLTTKRVLRPVRDGWLLPQDDRPAFIKGEVQAVETLVGNPIDEGGNFVANWDVKTVDQFHALLKKEFTDWADEAKTMYPVSSDADVGAQLALVFGDCQFTYGSYGVARALIRKQPNIYRYLFTRHRGGGKAAPRHGAESNYIFGSLDATDGRGEYDARDRELSDTIQNAWIRFAKSGNPNGAGVPQWSPYDRATNPIMELGETLSLRQGWRNAQMEFLDRYYDAHPGA